jgi:Zn-dependent protease with chaperone function
MLAPLIGSAAWQAESRAVVQELVANLSTQDQARVATVPLVFDPHPNEVNAFAGCDDSGAPFVAATEGLLEAIDGIAQTKAADEIYGTQTYDAYVNAVAPRLVSKDGGSALLPIGILPPQAILDPRRASRAHEMFDEIIAFAFGHELSHHYLGHTGCSAGQPAILPAIAQLDQMASAAMPFVNQPNEAFADHAGCVNLLDTGRARASTAYRWTEEGALWLLDFFARLDRASGANPWLGFLRTHPNPGLRIPLVQAAANTWRLQHPG